MNLIQLVTTSLSRGGEVGWTPLCTTLLGDLSLAGRFHCLIHQWHFQLLHLHITNSSHQSLEVNFQLLLPNSSFLPAQSHCSLICTRHHLSWANSPNWCTKNLVSYSSAPLILEVPNIRVPQSLANLEQPPYRHRMTESKDKVKNSYRRYPSSTRGKWLLHIKGPIDSLHYRPATSKDCHFVAKSVKNCSLTELVINLITGVPHRHFSDRSLLSPMVS